MAATVQSPDVSIQPKSSSLSALPSIAAWLFVLLLSAASIMELKAPDSLPATVPPTEFSAERAFSYVNNIARTPHPIGSPANAEVREYLLAQLSKLGLNPQVFSAIGVEDSGRSLAVGNIHDVIGRLSGTANSKAVLLMAHYDSVSGAPGAADDAAGVAAILETVRALRAGSSTLKNDLIILFTDGEEEGLFGAEAFASSHPWAKDVGVVLNFEARGNRGPSLLFETSSNNRSLVNAFAKAAPHPIGSSLFYSLYKLLPNDTDFTAFRALGTPGLNFAFGENLEAYHSRLDSPELLSRASLQHHGTYALSLVREFGQADLNRLKNEHGDDVFFNWFGSDLLHYDQIWVLPGVGVATVLLILIFALSFRRREISVNRIFKAIGACLACMIAMPVAMAVVGWFLFTLLAGRMLAGDTPANAYLLVGLVMLGASVGVIALMAVRKRASTHEFALASLIVLNVLSWAMSLLLPAGSYLLFWPMLLTLTALLVIEAISGQTRKNPQYLAGLIGLTAAILLFAPFAYLLYVFLTLQVVTVAATGLLLGLLFLAASSFLDMLAPRLAEPRLALILLICAVSLIAEGTAKSRYSSEHPRPDTLAYGLDLDDHTASWIGYDRSPDNFTSQFIGKSASPHPLPKYLAGSQFPVLSSPAPVIELAPPVLEVTKHTNQGDLHKLQMLVRSQRSTTRLCLAFDNEVQFVSIKVAGRTIRVDQKPRKLRLNLFGMPPDGVEVELELKTSFPISFWLLDQSNGLPQQQSRPKEFIEYQGGDTTIVCRKYTL